MARYTKMHYYTDKEVKNIFAQSDSEPEDLSANSDNESNTDILGESDDRAEDEMVTPEPSYVPPGSSGSADHSDSNESDAEIPQHSREKLESNLVNKTLMIASGVNKI
ncbi:hypothetical protein WA026_017756 [Henosepilachna vigintioctopunctata]|uniref:Uncharacterized protein n=1 Tax=Henosepilachna vigintioctopunctata TaxID=420089 RepID=A0AAW1U9T6_9CUCU